MLAHHLAGQGVVDGLEDCLDALLREAKPVRFGMADIIIPRPKRPTVIIDELLPAFVVFELEQAVLR